MDGTSNGASASIFTVTPARSRGPSVAPKRPATAPPPAPRPAPRAPQPVAGRRVIVASKAAVAASRVDAEPLDPPSPLTAQQPLLTPQPLFARQPPPTVLDAITEARLIAIIEAPLAPGETAMHGFARKEAELATAFTQLTILEAGSLQRRLSINAPDDALAAVFARLTVERRNRLVAFLGDARRRQAIAAARR
jgi:hypothetical protein